MPARVNKPISVTLGPLAAKVESRVKAGQYGSASEVVRAGLLALEREETALDEILKAKVRRALAEPEPPLPARDAFAEVDARIAEHKARRGR
jgi:antitoxin ParD1/3/4